MPQDTGVNTPKIRIADTNGNVVNISNDTTIANVAQQIQVINSLTPNVYDYISLSYTGSNLTTVTYKINGASGSTISTLTLAYSGNNLISVTRS